MNKPRDENGRFLRTNPNAWVRPQNLPQYHPAHASTQANVLLRKIIALRDEQPLVAEPVAADPDDINAALRQVIQGATVGARRDQIQELLNQQRESPTTHVESPNLSDLLQLIVAGTNPAEEGNK